ncbi:MAG TPA: J domain-containing protein [Ramlibacter sp.]|uniref:J domain-containing protein n=1 Tax=Ramlibacter sp. TaxID=1917967 RepID=UPI002B7E174B|nr:J domain-containing protein [Ramlibacter sp.]HVZ44674.1 J domain-containing protein [Ramlibacter sp.]
MAIPLPTYYDVLQVERDATPEGIRHAWRRLAHKYHPDKMPGNANAVRAMAAINAAYEVLSDPHRRAEHDVWIERAESRPMGLAGGPVQSEEAAGPWAVLNPLTGWPWYLLFATMAFSLGTIVTALYMTAMPAR